MSLFVVMKSRTLPTSTLFSPSSIKSFIASFGRFLYDDSFLIKMGPSLCFVAFSEQSVNELVCRNAKPFALYLVKANSANLSFIRLIISALCLANLKVQRFMVRQCIFERKCSIQIPLAGGIDSFRKRKAFLS